MPVSKCLIASVLAERRNVGISVWGILSAKKKNEFCEKNLGKIWKNIMYRSISLEE